MTRPFSLHIAGLEFVVSPEDALPIREDDAIYRPFVEPSASVFGVEKISVTLEIADPAPDPSWPIFFDSGETWLAFQEQGQKILVFRSPVDDGRFWWQARIGDDGREVRLVFAPELIDQTREGRSLSNPLRYPVDQLLTMLLLGPRSGCIVHAAGIGRSGRAVACIGRSGAGKTTLMKHLEPLEDTLRLSDDRLVIRLIDGRPIVFGTPWAGEGLVAANASADLQTLVFLHQSDHHRLEEIDPAMAAHQLFPTTSIPWFDEQGMTDCLETIDALVAMVPAYNLHFRNHPGVADLIESLL